MKTNVNEITQLIENLIVKETNFTNKSLLLSQDDLNADDIQRQADTLREANLWMWDEARGKFESLIYNVVLELEVSETDPDSGEVTTVKKWQVSDIVNYKKGVLGFLSEQGELDENGEIKPFLNPTYVRYWTDAMVRLAEYWFSNGFTLSTEPSRSTTHDFSDSSLHSVQVEKDESGIYMPTDVVRLLELGQFHNWKVKEEVWTEKAYYEEWVTRPEFDSLRARQDALQTRINELNDIIESIKVGKLTSELVSVKEDELYSASEEQNQRVLNLQTKEEFKKKVNQNTNSAQTYETDSLILKASYVNSSGTTVATTNLRTDPNGNLLFDNQDGTPLFKILHQGNAFYYGTITSAKNPATKEYVDTQVAENKQDVDEKLSMTNDTPETTINSSIEWLADDLVIDMITTDGNSNIFRFTHDENKLDANEKAQLVVRRNEFKDIGVAKGFLLEDGPKSSINHNATFLNVEQSRDDGTIENWLFTSDDVPDKSIRKKDLSELENGVTQLTNNKVNRDGDTMTGVLYGAGTTEPTSYQNRSQIATMILQATPTNSRTIVTNQDANIISQTVKRTEIFTLGTNYPSNLAYVQLGDKTNFVSPGGDKFATDPANDLASFNIMIGGVQMDGVTGVANSYIKRTFTQLKEQWNIEQSATINYFVYRADDTIEKSFTITLNGIVVDGKLNLGESAYLVVKNYNTQGKPQTTTFEGSVLLNDTTTTFDNQNVRIYLEKSQYVNYDAVSSLVPTFNDGIIVGDVNWSDKADKTYVDDELNKKENKRTLYRKLDNIQLQLDGTEKPFTEFNWADYKGVIIQGVTIPQQETFEWEPGDEPIAYIIFKQYYSDGTYSLLQLENNKIFVKWTNSSAKPVIRFFLINK